MNLLAYIRTVLWCFIGIGSRSGNSEALAKVKPLNLLGVAALLLVVFVVTIIGLANLAGSTLK